ncbi:MAG: hypothetical protein PQJ60_11860, partial [Spirochaetales bacterium]|nr:hypothetical protein [Spirochaetales bacterium]
EAKMDMHLIYPRPEEETSDEARYKWAHTGMTYEIPLGVQGGAWPFLYEIIDSPDGATLGRVYGDDNYGNISWPVPETASGSYHFEVQVTDQEYDTLTIEWDVKIDNDMFVFIEDGYTGTQTGSIDEPLEDFSDWYLDDAYDDTYSGRIVVLREGEYTLDGDGDTEEEGDEEEADFNNNTKLLSDYKTHAFIAYPGEDAVVDCSTSKILVHDDEASEDFFVAGIRWENARDDVGNSHFFWMSGGGSRSVFWNNTFYQMTEGTSGSDNPCTVFYSSTKPNERENLLYKDNILEEINNSGNNNGSYVDIYTSKYVLVEGNEAYNNDVYRGFWMKATNAFVTVRNNVAVENVWGTQIETGYGGEVSYLPHDHEVCWNRIVLDDEVSPYSSVLIWAKSDTYQGESYNSWIYRNTFVHGRVWLRYSGAEKYQTEDNIVISDLLEYFLNEDEAESKGDLTGDTSCGIVDEEGLLTGDYRSAYLGLKGAEIDTTLLSSGGN